MSYIKLLNGSVIPILSVRVDSLYVEMAVALMPFGYIFVFPYNK